MRIIYFIFSIALIGCASMVTNKRILENDPNAPVISGPNGGEIKYPAHLGKGREKAYRKMREYCDGPYKIISEQESFIVRRIKFECIPEPDTTSQEKTEK